MIKKRTRKELYDKFRQGAIPTGADFADFIRSQLNLLEDGIDVPEDPDEPIMLRAHGTNEDFLDLSDVDGRKRWKISGKNETEEENSEGLNFTADGKSRLFIGRRDGNVGIDQDKPLAKLHIRQNGPSDAFRVDDEQTDETPFIITSEGKAGLGTSQPTAKLHISSTGSGDVLKIDSATGDTSRFLIDRDGNVGIGTNTPAAKLSVIGGLSVGENTTPPADGLFVKGNLAIGGNIVLKGADGTDKLLELDSSGSISVKNEDLYIFDNLHIKASTGDGLNANGDLLVEGNTDLGDPGEDTTLTINGKIRSGEGSTEPYQLDVNETLIVDREATAPLVEVRGDLNVQGYSRLGNNQNSDMIYLNGTVQREGAGEDVTIDDNLVVRGNIVLGGNNTDRTTHVGPVTSEQNVTMDRDLNVAGVVSITERLVVAGVNFAHVPAGIIVMWSGQVGLVPVGWALCDGANGTPDLRDRFIVAAGRQYTIREAGGHDRVALTLAEMPSHNHDGNTGSKGKHTHSYKDYYYIDTGKHTLYATAAGDSVGHRTEASRTTGEASNHTHPFTTSLEGSGHSHENRPLFLALAFIMKL